MKRLSILLYGLLLCTFSVNAQLQFSDSVRISLLTCGSGPDAYERFGHTAIRIQDLHNAPMDIVFHYGLFSFNTPNFIYRFVKGETDYQLGAVYMRDFYNEYKMRGLWMKEQTLALDSLQTQNFIKLLFNNYLPQNRTYRYNYFFDNCATRPFNLLNKATGGAICYDSTWVEPRTYRQMVRQKTLDNTWLDMGITLAIAHGSDIPIGFDQQIFLPDYLAYAYDHASINGHPLVTHTQQLLHQRSDITELLARRPSITDPMPVTLCILLISIILLTLRIKQQRPQARHTQIARILSNSFDTILLLATGLTASIIWFLNFFSEHPTVDNNLNCVWLWPSNILFSILIWIKLPQKVHRIYFLLNFAAVLIYISITSNGWQEGSAPLMLLAISLLLRDIERSYFND